MTCMDCVHYDVCQDYLIECAEHGEAERLLNPCSKFKNKADYAEVKHGHWIPIPYNTTKPYPYECNRCGRVADREYEYCHCGAKMDGGGAE